LALFFPATSVFSVVKILLTTAITAHTAKNKTAVIAVSAVVKLPLSFHFCYSEFAGALCAPFLSRRKQAAKNELKEFSLKTGSSNARFLFPQTN